MTNIFIHVYLDEDVDVLVASLLRSRGFEATTTHQARQLGKSDADQLEYAVIQSRRRLSSPIIESILKISQGSTSSKRNCTADGRESLVLSPRVFAAADPI